MRRHAAHSSPLTTRVQVLQVAVYILLRYCLWSLSVVNVTVFLSIYLHVYRSGATATGMAVNFAWIEAEKQSQFVGAFDKLQVGLCF